MVDVSMESLAKENNKGVDEYCNVFQRSFQNHNESSIKKVKNQIKTRFNSEGFHLYMEEIDIKKDR
jgi:hypothetical protein